ncbi:hypothetical protein PG991_010611 [Apiospora marii]|uniref:Uncharacterized protein n=1 Tax=Apiospora marii TaxID=335849 RepID=A0ABR1RC73_9PEZI
MSWFFSSKPPPPKLGEKCLPGQAKRGTVLAFIEYELKEKLKEQPDDDDLEAMEAYLNELEIVQKEQSVVDTYFVHKCMKHYKLVAGLGGGTSAASRTSPSDIGSVSPSSRKTAPSSVADGSVAAESVSISFFPPPLPSVGTYSPYALAL